MPDRIEKELDGAKAAGKAPQFEVRRFRFFKSWHDGRRYNCVALVMDIDGKEVISVQKQIIDLNVISPESKRKVGAINLIERALKANIIKRWPEFREDLETVRATNYTNHEIGDEKDCVVSVSMHIEVPFGKKKSRLLHARDIDTIDATLSMLITAYHWVSWRLCRRKNGNQIKAQKLNKDLKIGLSLNIN